MSLERRLCGTRLIAFIRCVGCSCSNGTKSLLNIKTVKLEIPPLQSQTFVSVLRDLGGHHPATFLIREMSLYPHRARNYALEMLIFFFEIIPQLLIFILNASYHTP